MLYFAYGSNLDWNRMRNRCPSARFVGRARLDNYRLAFSRASRAGHGVADVIPAAGASVWGVIYDIGDLDVAELDRCEGYRAGRDCNSYERVELGVVGDDNDGMETTRVFVYVANAQENPPKPSRGYLDLILSGARHWRLPDDYVDALERVVTQ